MTDPQLLQFVGRSVLVAAGRRVPMSGQGRLIRRPEGNYHIVGPGGSESIPFRADEVLKIRLYDSG